MDDHASRTNTYNAQGNLIGTSQVHYHLPSVKLNKTMTVQSNSTSSLSRPSGLKKNLDEMMLEYSDLSRPSRGNTFPKSAPKADFKTDAASRGRTITPGLSATTYSTTSCRSGSKSMSHENARHQSRLPHWCLDDANIPQLYRVVQQLVTKNGVLDTSLIYPVLLSSGVHPDVLGHIWGLVNLTSPGQLMPHELNAALGLVALVQAGCIFSGVEILLSFQQPPIPFLQHPALCVQHHPQPLLVTSLAEQPPTPMAPVARNAAGITASTGEQAEEFAEFMSAPSPPPVAAVTQHGTSAKNTPSSVGSSTVGSRLANYKPEISPSNSTTAAHTVQLQTPQIQDDEFSDFQQFASSTSVSVPESSAAVENDKYAVFRELETVQSGGENCNSSPEENISVTANGGLFTDVSHTVELTSTTAADKYSFLRKIDQQIESSQQEPVKDDEFGDFLSVNSPSEPTPPPPPVQDFLSSISSNSNLTKPETTGTVWSTLHHEANHDPFQSVISPEFQLLQFQNDRNSSNPATTSSSVTGVFATAMQDQDESEEFGDFLSPGDTTGQGDAFSTTSNSVLSKDTASAECQSICSFDLGNMDGFTFGSDLSRHGSLPSLDLKVTPEGDADFKDFQSGFSDMALDGMTKLEVKAASSVLNPSTHTQSNSVLPLVDRYSCVRNEIESHSDMEKNIYEWERCLQSCYQLISSANDILSDISSGSVCSEVVHSEEGSEYLKNIVEIYRLVSRVRLSIKTSDFENETVHKSLQQIDLVWNHLSEFFASSSIMPRPESLDFSRSLLTPEPENNQRACGICLLSVEATPQGSPSQSTPSDKLFYGGRQYHTTCANFWLNCVNSLLPALTLQQQLL